MFYQYNDYCGFNMFNIEESSRSGKIWKQNNSSIKIKEGNF